jgi:hypothetical protein
MKRRSMTIPSSLLRKSSSSRPTVPINTRSRRSAGKTPCRPLSRQRRRKAQPPARTRLDGGNPGCDPPRDGGIRPGTGTRSSRKLWKVSEGAFISLGMFWWQFRCVLRRRSVGCAKQRSKSGIRWWGSLHWLRCRERQHELGSRYRIRRHRAGSSCLGYTLVHPLQRLDH